MSDATEPSPPTPAEGSMTSSSSSSTTSPDNFSVVNKLHCMISSSTKSQFNQVIFHDLQELYPCDSDIRCSYSLTDDIHPQPGDKISLFKVGWNSVSEYISFVRPNVNISEGRIKHIVIPAADLPKDPGDAMYQLCYISSGNVVAGASIPFSFHKPHESELVAVEDPNDPGLLVFRSRAGQLQDQLHAKTEQCKELKLECALKDQKLDILRQELDESDARVASMEEELKELRQGRDAQITCQQKLEESQKQCTEQEETIKNLQNQISELQAIISDRERELQKAQEDSIKSQESLDSLVQFRALNDSLQQEVNQATQYAQELKAELHVKQLTIANLIHENERFEKQNAEWELKLKQAVLMQNKAVSDKLETENELAKAENVIRDLSQRVQETRAFIQDIQSTGSTDERQAKMIDLEDRLLVANIQLQDLKEVHSLCSSQISDLQDELQRTKEAHEMEVAQLVSDKVECQEKIQSLLLEMKNKRTPVSDPMSDLYGILKRTFQTVPTEEPKPSNNSPAYPPKDDHCDGMEARLQNKKRELQEQLVQVRHERDEIHSCLKNANEENASLKSRISVLELELSALKTNAGVYKTGGSQNIVSALEAFNKNIDVIEKFNQTVEECKQWKTKFDEQKRETLSLQAKVEDLLLKDGRMCDELARIKKEAVKNKELIEQEYFEMMTKAVQGMTKDLKAVKDKYRAEKKEKEALEVQLIEARKDLVGRVSVESCKKIMEENEQLQAQLTEQKRVAGCLKSFVFAVFESATTPIHCPMCPTVFPRQENEKFLDHFTTHVD